MGDEKQYADYLYADELNTIERNLTALCTNTYPFSVGEEKTYFPNLPTPDWQEFNRAKETVLVTLTVSGWTGTAAPYIQTVTINDAKENMEPILVSALADGASEAVQKAYRKAFGIVSSGTASVGDGTATFKMYKKPVTDIVVGLKGV